MKKELIISSIVTRVISFAWEPVPDHFNIRDPDSLLPLVRNTSYSWDKIPFDNIYVFGDSSCDSGRFFKTENGKGYDLGAYWKDRVSDGPMWVEFLEAMNRTPVNSLCVAGTTIDSSHFVIEKGMPDFAGQIEMFSKEKNLQAKRPLAILGFVGNDLINPLITISKVGSSIKRGLLNLIDNHGVKDFVLMGAVFEFHYAKHYDEELVKVREEVIRIRPDVNILILNLLHLTVYSPRIAPPTSRQSKWVAPPCYNSFIKSRCDDPENHFLVDAFHVTVIPQYNIASTLSKSISGYWAIE